MMRVNNRAGWTWLENGAISVLQPRICSYDDGLSSFSLHGLLDCGATTTTYIGMYCHQHDQISISTLETRDGVSLHETNAATPVSV